VQGKDQCWHEVGRGVGVGVDASREPCEPFEDWLSDSPLLLLKQLTSFERINYQTYPRERLEQRALT